MKDVGELLVEIFQKQPYAELSTSELIKQLYPKEYERIKTALHDPLSDKEARTVAKRHKGQLHRRLLYHLNRLVEENTISVSSIKGKGEKCYNLTHQHRKEQKYYLPETPLTQPLDKLESYRDKGILLGYDKRGWHHRLNAILLEIHKEDTIQQILERIATISTHVNDAIGLHSMERILIKEDLNNLTNFLKELDIDTRDNNKTISLLIDLTETPRLKYVEDFFEAFALLQPNNMNIVLTITPKFIDNHQRLLKKIVKSFSHNTIKINLHNKAIHTPPILVGRAGTYTLTEEEWKHHTENSNKETIGLCIGQISVGVDIHRFFKEYNNTEFKKFIRKVARALVECTTLQRRRADLAFKELNQLSNKPHEFFKYSTNYIRLWNYDWKEENHPHFAELIATCTDELEQFCATEETIFKSCGIPIRFKAVLASMFSKFEPRFFSKRNYQKFSVTGLKAMQEKDFRTFITAREKLVKHLKYNDRFRIFRTTPINTEEIIKEIKHLMHEYSLPHITYDFAERRADMTLDQFMNGGRS